MSDMYKDDCLMDMAPCNLVDTCYAEVSGNPGACILSSVSEHVTECKRLYFPDFANNFQSDFLRNVLLLHLMKAKLLAVFTVKCKTRL